MTRLFGRVRHGVRHVTTDVRLLTYDEIAGAFSITRESARQLVIRKRWGRRKGNDGRARVEVPEDALESVSMSDATPSGTSDDTGANPSVSTGDDTYNAPSDDTADLSAAVAILERHTGRLEGELAAVRMKLEAAEGALDAERARAAQVDVLTAVLEIERTRLAEVRQEADRWRETAAAPRGLWAWLKRA